MSYCDACGRDCGCRPAPAYTYCTCPVPKLIVQPADERFHERRGCLTCDKWLDPVRLKRS